MKEKSEVFAGLVSDLVGHVPMEEAVKLLECGMIQRALDLNGGNQSAASRMLEIHRNTLQKKRVQYGIGEKRSRPRRKPASREGRASGAAQRPSRRGKTGIA
jgi:DNA-binding NtrC family response regulator